MSRQHQVSYDELAFDFDYIVRDYPWWLRDAVERNIILRAIDKKGLCFVKPDTKLKWREGDVMSQGDVTGG